MKLNVEVELNWIDEDDSIDEAIRRKIVSQVLSQIKGPVIDKIQKEAMQELDTHVGDYATTMVAGFLDKPVVLTDNYGDTTSRYENVTEMLKERFDNFLDTKVNSEGRVSNDSCGYGNKKHTRIDFLLKKMVREYGDKWTKDMVKEIETAVKSYLDDELKTRLTQMMKKTLPIESMIKKAIDKAS